MKFVIVALLFLTGCANMAQSHVLIGTARPAISPDEVKLYLKPPAKYEEIAMVDASSRASWAATDQGKTDKVIERLKAEAAALGANGVLIDAVGNESAGSVGTATAYRTGASAYGTGISGNIFMKSGRGLAIYVPSTQ